MDWQEDAIVAEGMISISQWNFYGDDDEHVSETQFKHEQIINNMKVAIFTELPANSACDIPHQQ